MTASNFFDNISANLPDELIQILASSVNCRIERIVSCGHASPEGFWYDLPQREWVLLLKGAARIRFDDQTETLAMNPGDFVDIAAHRKHRVEWTDPTQATVWLAIHFD